MNYALVNFACAELWSVEKEGKATINNKNLSGDSSSWKILASEISIGPFERNYFWGY